MEIRFSTIDPTTGEAGKLANADGRRGTPPLIAPTVRRRRYIV